MAERAKRPFWMHQLVEYILGGALVASGLQSPEPVVPAVVGGVVLLFAASTKGAMSAFRLLDRRLHRWFDPVLVLVQIAAALQPWVSVDNATRAIMVAIAVVHAVVWLGSSFAEKPKRAKKTASGATGASGESDASSGASGASDVSTAIGQKAGRLVGGGVNMVRAAKAKRDAKNA
jgi:hypothetical protein